MRLECQTAQSKENKKASRHKIRNTKKMDLDRLLRFCDLVFCQTARSKENKKTSRHTIRNYIESYEAKRLMRA